MCGRRRGADLPGWSRCGNSTLRCSSVDWPASVCWGSARRRARAGIVALTAAATWVALGGTTLARTGAGMADLLEAGDIAGARQLLPSLCGRDPAALDSDGLVGPPANRWQRTPPTRRWHRCCGLPCAGVPGVLVYRGINTLDAMVGNRSPRYHRFGWLQPDWMTSSTSRPPVPRRPSQWCVRR